MKIISGIFSLKASDALAAFASTAFSTVFSPGWWLTKSLLAPYFNMDQLLANGLSAESIVKTSLALHGLGSQVLLQQVLPILVFCLIASVGYLFLSCWLGKKMCQLALQRLQANASA